MFNKKELNTKMGNLRKLEFIPNRMENWKFKQLKFLSKKMDFVNGGIHYRKEYNSVNSLLGDYTVAINLISLNSSREIIFQPIRNKLCAIAFTIVVTRNQ